MTSRNDITGDEIKTKIGSDNYRDGWERIFGNKKEPEQPQAETKNPPTEEEKQ